MAPSSPSVMPAATNTTSASRYCRSTSRMRKIGIATSRSKVSMFGMVSTSDTSASSASLRPVLQHPAGDVRRHHGGDVDDSVVVRLLEDATGAPHEREQVAARDRQRALDALEP